MKIKTLLALNVLFLILTGPAWATRYALLVGVDEYASISSLSSCVSDAHGMRRCLAEDTSRWSAANMTLLSNTAATKTAVRSAMQAWASTASSGDMVLFFQSSHGGQVSGTDSFLCAYDAYYQDYELAADLALFADGVTVIIVIDACHSAGMFKSAEATVSASNPEWNFAQNVMAHHNSLMSTESKAVSVGWVTACDYDELSWAGSSYSLCAAQLVYGFAHGDTNADGALSFKELYDYAKPRTLLANPTQTVQLLNESVLISTIAADVVPFDPDVENAVDQASLDVHALHGAVAPWFRQTSTTHDGTDAAQSGVVSHRQASDFGIRVVGPGTISFWWKASCEGGYDWLLLLDNNNVVNGISGTTAWIQRTYKVGPGEHMLRWIYKKDESYSSGDDCGWVDQITWVSDAGSASTQIPEAIDDALMPANTGGNAPWTRQTSPTHDGTDAAQSGPSLDNECSWFTTDIIGPGDLSFWWRVSSEEGSDMLDFSIDETIQARISGDVAWQQETWTIGTGTHTLGWCYFKNYGSSTNSDCGWVDQVVWTGECDTDGDGIPTGWEMDHGLDYSNASGEDGADGNPDGDVHNNMEEYICGTDPTNAASCFRITDGFSPAASGFVIEWQSVSGRTYNTYWATALDETFQPLETGIEYPRNSCTDTLHSAGGECFYKIDVELQ